MKPMLRKNVFRWFVLFCLKEHIIFNIYCGRYSNMLQIKRDVRCVVIEKENDNTTATHEPRNPPFCESFMLLVWIHCMIKYFLTIIYALIFINILRICCIDCSTVGGIWYSTNESSCQVLSLMWFCVYITSWSFSDTSPSLQEGLPLCVRATNTQYSYI